MVAHYQKLYSRLSINKDSIFEPCMVLSYDPDKVTAQVYCLNSQQQRQHVPVLFPSYIAGVGAISPPAPQSTGLLFWGAERQPFLFPAQFTPLRYEETEDGFIPTASPDLIDSIFSIGKIEGGEHYISSLGGSFIHVKNAGEIELGTSSFIRLSILESDQKIDIRTPKLSLQTNGISLNLLQKDNVAYQLLEFKSPDVLGTITDQELIQKGIEGNFSNLIDANDEVFYRLMQGGVVSGDNALVSPIDNSLLVSREEVINEDQIVFQRDLSKSGNLVHTVKNQRYITKMTVKPGSVEFEFEDTQAANPSERFLRYSYGFGG